MVHKIEKKDVAITGEEIFLPTSPDSLGGEKQELSTTVEYKTLPTKPEEVD
jgi:hypothetical protein